MMNKWILTTGMIFTATLSAFNASAETKSGYCGAYNETTDTFQDNCQWTLSQDGTLTISGTGNMFDSSSWLTGRPWDDDIQNITNVKISNGITSIGDGAFAFSRLSSVEIPQSVTAIGGGAFAYSRLSSVEIPKSVTSIGDGAFEYTQLTNIDLPEGLTQIAQLTLRGLHLENLIIPDGVTSIGWWTFKNGVVDNIYCTQKNQQMCYDALVDSQQDVNALKLYSKDKRTGTYVLDDVRYKSFNDMQKQNNGVEIKRIYTIQEATQASGQKNSVMLRYK